MLPKFELLFNSIGKQMKIIVKYNDSELMTWF